MESFDKRKITARENLKKAREAKLSKLKEQKMLKEESKRYYKDNSSDSSSSYSEEEITFIQPKKKSKQLERNPVTDEIAELKEMIRQIAMSKKGGSKKVKKVYVPQQAQPSQPPANITYNIQPPTHPQADAKTPESVNLIKRQLLKF